MDRGKEFSELVHRILVTERRGSLDQTAEKLGLNYDALYARLRGRVTFTADEVRALIAHVRDTRIVAWVLSGTPYLPAERAKIIPDVDEDITLAESLRRTAMVMMFEATDAAEQVELALIDNRIDLHEAARIREDIDAAERAMATLREHVRRATT